MAFDIEFQREMLIQKCALWRLKSSLWLLFISLYKEKVSTD